ncbi:MAG TPA: DUF4126 domain-containing protein [Candidatus Polarisedimenticolia bacterium]|nr:DUF4126 domain-containing protein [Candidatus Polarisedimenticolia bacterium]
MEHVLGVLVALGLSAACGFRIFVPVLVISIAARTGHLVLASQFEWIGATPALIAFALATLLEVTAYYVPWLDNLLDTLATPAAVIAGIVVSASVIVDLDPFLKWTLAVIAGGGVAGGVQLLTTGTRQVSTITTAGAANPVVSTVELGSSTFLSALSLFAPLLVLFAVVTFVLFALNRLRQGRARA